MTESIYAAIDLKSFYASVECVERNLDPLDTNLVVADQTRTSKTICLAVTPALKSFGIPGRPRLFEVNEAVKAINIERQKYAPNQRFAKKSINKTELDHYNFCKLNFLIAKPRMALYIKYAVKVFQVYRQFVAPEDIHVYSIDEVFIHLTPYLKANNQSAEEFVRMILTTIYQETGLTATCGIGTNLYLAKVAMDILAKHAEPDAYGSRIAALTPATYAEQLWTHTPLTDFWRFGRGISKRLEAFHIYTMKDLANAATALASDSVNAIHLRKAFGIQAELLMDHAFGLESATIQDIRNYRSKSKSFSSSQVLGTAYPPHQALTILKEMVQTLLTRTVEKGYAVQSVHFSIHYLGKERMKTKQMIRLDDPIVDFSDIRIKLINAYETSIQSDQLVKRISIAFSDLIPIETLQATQQLSLFDDMNRLNDENLTKKLNLQQTVITIQKKFGKNALIYGHNLNKESTLKDRNQQIGGHLA